VIEAAQPIKPAADELPREVSWEANEAIASWRRVLDQTHGDKRPNFERACIELLRLARNEAPASRQTVVDCLQAIATDAALDHDEAQAIFARAAEAPPDGCPNAEQHRTNGHSASIGV
jgi:hypothetical protein